MAQSWIGEQYTGRSCRNCFADFHPTRIRAGEGGCALIRQTAVCAVRVPIMPNYAGSGGGERRGEKIAMQRDYRLLEGK